MRGGGDVDDLAQHAQHVVVARRVDGGDALGAQFLGVLVGNDPADDHRNARAPRDLGGERQVRARQDREADQVHALLQSGVHDLVGSESNALVDDLHARVAGEYRDLLRAARVTVEAGLADEQLQPAAQLLRDLVDARADRGELRQVAARRHGRVDARRRAVLAVHGAQRVGPLARRDSRVRAAHGGLHQVRPGLQRVAQACERRLDVPRVAPRALRAQALDLLASRRVVDREDRSGALQERRRLALAELVDAADDALPRLHLPNAPRVRLDRLLLHVARLDGGDRAALLLDAGDLRPRAGLDLRGLALDHDRALEDVGILEHVGLVREDLLDPE